MREYVRARVQYATYLILHVHNHAESQTVQGPARDKISSLFLAPATYCSMAPAGLYFNVASVVYFAEKQVLVIRLLTKYHASYECICFRAVHA